ncbi:hypothetical protein POM88_031657 [Heracleum sosnowskyi]|uniref:Uncharacterized protein n=1 Tax=Heracleum sosnowskyi TaxID=360622 RepID=A0AAD8HZ25_9APIA|nr:hypothetical protein POM88_031657 [Heracleum sosnowskyi]
MPSSRLDPRLHAVPILCLHQHRLLPVKIPSHENVLGELFCYSLGLRTPPCYAFNKCSFTCIGPYVDGLCKDVGIRRANLITKFYFFLLALKVLASLQALQFLRRESSQPIKSLRKESGRNMTLEVEGSCRSKGKAGL